MVFERKVQLNYENLSESTKLRFMELEIQAAIETLATTLFSYHREPNSHAKEVVALALVSNPSKEMLKDDLVQVFNTAKFRNPTKEEKIHYFRYKRIGVAKITKYAHVGPNTVQDMKDHHPNLHPVFTGWLAFGGLVKNWENLKHSINFFNDDLIQDKDSHLLQLDLKIPEDELEEVTASLPPQDITQPKYDDPHDPTKDPKEWIYIRKIRKWMPRFDEQGFEYTYL